MRALLAPESAIAALALLTPACFAPTRAVAPRADRCTVAAELTRVIEHELATKGLPALSIALVEDGEIVWAQGFGTADPETGRPATAETVYRVGSVSKLFTDIALMQLVEQGRVDLDAPVRHGVPDFAPENPFDTPITLRHLTSHRAGLVREPPVGNYFADDEPSLAATVASLNQTTLVHEPGTRTKYSNAGIAVVGRVLELAHDAGYAELMAREVLEPMGLENAAMLPTPEIEAQLARARMWSYDGSESDAPTFQLGMAPAGSLYASVLDLARFMQVVFDGGEGPRGAVLRPETLELMLTPATGPDGKPTRFGIGFAIDELDGHKRCGHGGAIYGFSTELSFLPDDGLGVAVATSMDFSNAVTTRIAEHALRALLAARAGEPVPRLPLSEPFGAERAKDLAGRYRAPGLEAELVARGDRLLLEWRGVRMEVRRLGERLVVDDRIEFGIELGPDPWAELRIAGVAYERLDDLRPAPCPERWREYLGEYGWDHNVLQVRENHGNLEALVEWFFFDRLTEQEPDQFALPQDSGLYPSEHLVFRRDADGVITHAVLGGVAFARRTPGAPDGETFHIDPLLPPAELRAIALEASAPPRAPDSLAPDLVQLIDHVPGLALDLRYATTNNFLSTIFYPEARALMQRPAALALAEAQAELHDKGYGLLIHDAYRPWHVTRMFWDATPEELRHFVADPSEGSRHNRGCAVDLTLIDLASGEPVLMTGGYDEFSARSYPEYPGGTSLQRWHRELLRKVMESHGFDVYQWEWWHFDYRDWRRYPILDLSFEEALTVPLK